MHGSRCDCCQSVQESRRSSGHECLRTYCEAGGGDDRQRFGGAARVHDDPAPRRQDLAVGEGAVHAMTTEKLNSLAAEAGTVKAREVNWHVLHACPEARHAEPFEAICGQPLRMGTTQCAYLLIRPDEGADSR